MVSKKVSCNTSRVGTGIILDKRESWALTKHWNDNGSKNTINILSCSQVAVYNYKSVLKVWFIVAITI